MLVPRVQAVSLVRHLSCSVRSTTVSELQQSMSLWVSSNWRSARKLLELPHAVFAEEVH